MNMNWVVQQFNLGRSKWWESSYYPISPPPAVVQKPPPFENWVSVSPLKRRRKAIQHQAPFWRGLCSYCTSLAFSCFILVALMVQLSLYYTWKIIFVFRFRWRWSDSFLLYTPLIMRGRCGSQIHSSKSPFVFFIHASLSFLVSIEQVKKGRGGLYVHSPHQCMYNGDLLVQILPLHLQTC